MMFRKAAVAAALAAAVTATMSPASAEDYVKMGVNTGDAGFISLTFGGGLSSTGDHSGTIELDARCEYYIQTVPNSGIAQLIVVGHAQAVPNAHGRAVSTGIRCVARNYFTGQVILDEQAANESMVAAAPFTRTIVNTAIVICAHASAHWQDNTFTRNFAEECIYPF